MKLRTILVDDERLARKELKSLLSNHNEIEIIAEYGDPQEAIRNFKIEPRSSFSRYTNAWKNRI